MLSIKLVQLIEGHWEEIAGRVIVSLRKHPDMQHLARRSDMELRDWCHQIVSNLSFLLSAPKDDEVKRRFQVMGRLRFEENVPLHETVLRLHILKDKIIGFVHEQGFPMTAMHLYAEEELEQRMGRFFDACVYHIIRGYEDAMHVAQRVGASIP